jgi:puromycin-sensitive aminopeptidase
MKSKFIFQKTPLMSTYLLAFVVGDFDFVEAKDANGVLCRVYTPVGKKEQGKFALDITIKTLPFYVDYFKIDYPLPKLDNIAIPDFSAGAMENWGLITYREPYLLVDPKNSSSIGKQMVAVVVGHEIAHQWFGNIVTMNWWTDLWLNEGFASWIEYLSVDYCMPELDIWTHFVFSDHSRALDLDSLRNSHPIEVEVESPAQIDEIFDAISYSKGAAIIRMLHNYIGDDNFRVGLHNYLDKYKYKNTFTNDLWQSLSDVSGKDIQRVMETWTKQTGYPYLNVITMLNL